MISPFLRRLRRALIVDMEPELLLAMRVAVLQAAGYRRSEIARQLPEATGQSLRAAEARVKRAAIALEAGDREELAA